MPIYTYQCQNCEMNFDFLVRNPDADSIVSCPKCGVIGVKKIPSLFGISTAGKNSPPAKGCSGKNCGSCSGCG